MVTFRNDDLPDVASGRITITWRLWKYAHVKAGKVYALGAGAIEVEDVRPVRVADVTGANAREVGQPDAAALVDLAAAHTGARVTPDTLLYRVQFRYRNQPPEKPLLAIEEIAKRLARLDAASPVGPWTLPVLRLIEDNPGVVSRRLAAEMALPTPYFKTNVRKLKALGLTISLEIGYELSELGQAYLDSLEDQP